MIEKYKSNWEKVAAKFSAIWGDSVLQVAIYNTELSDKGNLVVILSDDSIKHLVKAHSVASAVVHMGMEPPLVVSDKYIANSLDSFPLEFHNIKTDYINLVSKKDILRDLEFEKSYIRLEMERELKSKNLLIKMAILDHYGKNKVLKNLIKVSVHSIEPIIKGLLFLFDEDIPLNHKDLMNKADDVTDFDISSLLTATDFTIGKINIEKKDIPDFFEQFTAQLQDLTDHVEALKV